LSIESSAPRTTLREVLGKLGWFASAAGAATGAAAGSPAPRIDEAIGGASPREQPATPSAMVNVTPSNHENFCIRAAPDD
ncbi:MAG TPA: hypothetical protein VEQ58_00675, partial [Polyangiaceae bacterium]|nr:hypothetical protein [Polyangiaceae bacterium]